MHSQHKRGIEVFSSHDNPNFYVLDVVNAAICAAAGYAMASLCERRQDDALPGLEGVSRLSERTQTLLPQPTASAPVR